MKRAQPTLVQMPQADAIQKLSALYYDMNKAKEHVIPG